MSCCGQSGRWRLGLDIDGDNDDKIELSLLILFMSILDTFSEQFHVEQIVHDQ